MSTSVQNNDMLTPPEAARELGVSGFTIRNWFKDGVILGMSVQRRHRSILRIPRSEVERLKKQGGSTPAPKSSSLSSSKRQRRKR